MTSGGRDLSLYIQNQAEVRPIEFGEDGQAYAGHDICNVMVASNNKFFMIGVP